MSFIASGLYTPKNTKIDQKYICVVNNNESQTISKYKVTKNINDDENSLRFTKKPSL